MREREAREFASQRTHRAIMGNSAKRNYRAQFFHLADCLREIVAACPDLFGGWFVLGRHASYGIRDPAIDQLEPVVGVSEIFAPRKSELV